MKSLYKEAARLSGKDAESIRKFVEAEHLFPDLVEMDLDDIDVIVVLANLVKGNRRIRNAVARKVAS